MLPFNIYHLLRTERGKGSGIWKQTERLPAENEHKRKPFSITRRPQTDLRFTCDHPESKERLLRLTNTLLVRRACICTCRLPGLVLRVELRTKLCFSPHWCTARLMVVSGMQPRRLLISKLRCTSRSFRCAIPSY